MAVLTAASLSMVVWQRLAEPAIASGPTATLNGMTIDLQDAEWVPMDHVEDGRGGFVMPDQMMPGAPTGGDVRLGISVTLSNTDSGTREFNLVEELAVIGGLETEPQPLSSDTIGALPRLAPGAAVSGTLYFDIRVPDDDDPPLYVRWTRGGKSVQIPVPLTGDAPEHNH